MWLESKEEEILELKQEVKKLEVPFEKKSRLNKDDIREANDNLLEAVKEKKIGELLDKFDREKSEVKNFSIWNSFLHLVDILMKYIKD
ncbi:hypothetical protein DPMN_186995 [Dreissena polymorpha]|uniref:Uncharacterized protein n=1 Tax=Dreissena polymorpha TaxID=45954 RepID=A0A9D4I9X0_DREPO|nr:hypothetical protein DPMN_186995 [Dreissena polymorpha]